MERRWKQHLSSSCTYSACSRGQRRGQRTIFASVPAVTDTRVVVANFTTNAVDSLAVIGGALAVGGASGWTAGLVAQAIAPEREISRLRWGEECGFALTAMMIVGVGY